MVIVLNDMSLKTAFSKETGLVLLPVGVPTSWKNWA